MNFLKETQENLIGSDHTPEDIVFIGSGESSHQCTWAEFCVLANVEYNESYGTQEVAKDLIIVFSDGQRLVREEYDGSEWWSLVKPFERPRCSLPIRSLIGKSSWLDLAEINKA